MTVTKVHTGIAGASSTEEGTLEQSLAGGMGISEV